MMIDGDDDDQIMMMMTAKIEVRECTVLLDLLLFPLCTITTHQEHVQYS